MLTTLRKNVVCVSQPQVPTWDTEACRKLTSVHYYTFLFTMIYQQGGLSKFRPWFSLANKQHKWQNLCIVCGIFIYLSSIFNLGQVKFKYLINHAILKLNANRHRLITISRGGSIYEMSLKIVYPQANRCQPSFRLNVSFAVNTETERYGLGAGS